MLLLRTLDPRANAYALKETSDFFRKHWALVLHMTIRELKDRYAGQVLGTTWAIIAPLLTMATYVFAFTMIFRTRLGIDDTGSGYTTFVLAGLVPWLAVQDVLSRASSAVVSSANLVKQIVFPSEVLPVKIAIASLPSLLVGIAVLIPLSAHSGDASALGLLVLLPLALLLFLIIAVGFAYILAAAGVFIRDVREIVSFLLSIGLFLHPILYPPQNIPHWLNNLFAFSPFSHLIWCFRDALVDGAPIHPWSWLVSAVFSLAIMITGWRAFRMLKPSFGNVL